eukprot:3105235-Rhodomonas_salina.1
MRKIQVYKAAGFMDEGRTWANGSENPLGSAARSPAADFIRTNNRPSLYRPSNRFQTSTSFFPTKSLKSITASPSSKMCPRLPLLSTRTLANA